jgi:hypothetical protein
MNLPQLFRSLSMIALLSSPAQAEDLCKGNTYRCSNLEGCSINGKVQPCAYGSGGASSSALIFGHGVFNIEWTDEESAVITYGSKGKHKAKAELLWNDKGKSRAFVLDDGVVIVFPADIPHFDSPMDFDRLVDEQLKEHLNCRGGLAINGNDPEASCKRRDELDPIIAKLGYCTLENPSGTINHIFWIKGQAGEYTSCIIQPKHDEDLEKDWASFQNLLCSAIRRDPNPGARNYVAWMDKTWCDGWQ